MTDQPEPCISGRCLSPLACGGFGYCRDRNHFTSDPSDAVKERWRNIAAKMNAPHASAEDIAKRLGDVVENWPALLPPNAFVQVRADVITAAYAEIERLRTEKAQK